MSFKVAIVTGSSSGIGRASAIALVKEGWSVVLSGRRLEQLEETARLAHGNTFIVQGDLSKPVEIDRLFSETEKQYGRLDLLFNNAGMSAPATPLEDITYEQWQNCINLNLTAPFLCTQHAFRLMKKNDPPGGRIINNGSLSAHVPRPFSSPYTSTKHAITGLTRSTSLDGRKYNIACGQIDIGNADSSMTQRMSEGVLQPDGKRMVEPVQPLENVARAVVYMASLELDANVQFMTVMATKMPFIGRG